LYTPFLLYTSTAQAKQTPRPSNSDIMPSALLIGEITHARKEWEELSSILTLKV
jgi:hypothetical protein